jgi:CHASE1-domain containing sensor protein
MIVCAQRRFRSRYVVIAVTALLGMLASIGAFWLVLSWERRVAEIDFQSKARSYLEVINADLDDARTLLYTLGAYMGTAEHPVSRRQFERFTQVLHSRVAGVRNIDWAPAVTRAQRPGFERDVLAAAGIPDHDRILERTARGALVPARDRSVYFPMMYVQAGPEFGGSALRSLLGFDVASEPLRLAAIERAVRTGQPEATPPLRIIGVPGAMGGVVSCGKWSDGPGTFASKVTQARHFSKRPLFWSSNRGLRDASAYRNASARFRCATSARKPQRRSLHQGKRAVSSRSSNSP